MAHLSPCWCLDITHNGDFCWKRFTSVGLTCLFLTHLFCFLGVPALFLALFPSFCPHCNPTPTYPNEHIGGMKEFHVKSNVFFSDWTNQTQMPSKPPMHNVYLRALVLFSPIFSSILSLLHSPTPMTSSKDLGRSFIAEETKLCVSQSTW